METGVIFSLVTIISMLLYMVFLVSTFRIYTSRNSKIKRTCCTIIAAMCLITAIAYFSVSQFSNGGIWIFNTTLLIYNIWLNHSLYKKNKEIEEIYDSIKRKIS